VSLRARLALIAILVATASLPAVTAHTLLPAILIHEHVGDDAQLQREFIPLLALTIVSCVPLVGMMRGASRWIAGHRRLRTVTSSGTRTSFRGIAYMRIPGDQVTLFTAGLRAPVIYATTGAERHLAPDALEAALLHEQAHVHHRDLVWLPVVACAEAAVGMMPFARKALHALRIEIEWRADRDALIGGAERQWLFDAIVGAADGVPASAALSGVGTVERLRWLADPSAQPIHEEGFGPVLAGLIAPPAVAHVLVWTGLVCVLCAHHLR